MGDSFALFRSTVLTTGDACDVTGVVLPLSDSWDRDRDRLRLRNRYPQLPHPGDSFILDPLEAAGEGLRFSDDRNLNPWVGDNDAALLRLLVLRRLRRLGRTPE